MVRHRGAGGHAAEIIARLNAAVVAALKDPEVARRIRTVGMEPTPTTPAGLSAYLEGDIAKAAKVAPWWTTNRTEREERGCKFDCCDGHCPCLFLA